MLTLRDYESLIRNLVKKIDEEDPNWTWTIMSFSEERVMIRWSYLKGESQDCFMIRLGSYDPEFDDYLITSRTPQDKMIDGHIVHAISDTRRSWQESFESALKSSVEKIASYAYLMY